MKKIIINWIVKIKNNIINIINIIQSNDFVKLSTNIELSMLLHYTILFLNDTIFKNTDQFIH